MIWYLNSQKINNVIDFIKQNEESQWKNFDFLHFSGKNTFMNAAKKVAWI